MSVAKKAVALKFLPFLYGQRVNDFHSKKSLEIEEQN